MYKVVISRKAQSHLESIYNYIAMASYPSRAESYVEGIRSECQSLASMPNRGTKHPSVRPGLRTIGYKHSATIAFRVSENTVTIVAVYYRGINVTAHL